MNHDPNELLKIIDGLKLTIREIKEENREIKEEYKEIKEENRKIKQENDLMNETINEMCFVDELYNHGIPKLIFTKIVTKDTEYKSNYRKINEVHENNIIRIINGIDTFIKDGNIQSAFLIECKRLENNIQFAIEELIQDLVKLYFSDLIAKSKLELNMLTGASIGASSEDKVYDEDEDETNKKRRSYKPDCWIVINNDYRPVLVVEVKSPVPWYRSTQARNNPPINDSKAIGQLYEYMLKQKNFYNQRFVFGILTSLDEWKIYWLPDTDEYSKSSILIENNIEIDDEIDNGDRILCSSIIYKHNEKSLAKIILSIIIKSYFSPRYPVDLLSTKRNYIFLSRNNWKWTKYKTDQIDKFFDNISFDMPHQRTNNFTVLRYFRGGKYSRVRLAMSDNGNLVVLKEFTESHSNMSTLELVEQEVKCWNKINNVKVYKTVVNNKDTLVMPLIFHIHDDRKNKILHLPLDLKIWCVEDKAIPGELPTYLENINDDIKNFSINLQNIDEEAIAKCANNGYYHDDLEFRHIGLRPIINNNRIEALDPVLIDFEYIKDTNNKDIAYNQMMDIINTQFIKYEEDGYVVLNE